MTLAVILNPEQQNTPIIRNINADDEGVGFSGVCLFGSGETAPISNSWL